MMSPGADGRLKEKRGSMLPGKLEFGGVEPIST